MNSEVLSSQNGKSTSIKSALNFCATFFAAFLAYGREITVPASFILKTESKSHPSSQTETTFNQSHVNILFSSSAFPIQSHSHLSNKFPTIATLFFFLSSSSNSIFLAKENKRSAYHSSQQSVIEREGILKIGLSLASHSLTSLMIQS
jgi:hypothetical protein